jgi:hypothetical protein
MWEDVVRKNTAEQVQDRVQRTGYCRRCQKMVTKYQKCNNDHLSHSKTNCPMREE